MKHLLLSAIAGCLALGAHAQQNVGFRTANINSPVVNTDKTVTFNIAAPKAHDVSVSGDWEANGGKGTLRKGKDGVWTYTTPALPSEMYTYRFTIDGVTTIDPQNPFTRRDVGNVFSYFFVNGGNADYYQVRDVPHG
ncbi:MAG TPA: esterase, partial [Prevotella sp.]|nr:esterase [Prevotella sp.]